MTLWSNEWPAPKSDDLAAGRESVGRKPKAAGSAGLKLWSNQWPVSQPDGSTAVPKPGARLENARAEEGSVERLILFSDYYPVTGPQRLQAMWERTGFSVVSHVVVVALVLAFIRFAPTGAMLSQPMESFPLHDIIFLNQPGPGGGGGGGGNRMKLPEKKATLSGEVRKPEPQPVPQMKPADSPPPPPLDVPAKTSFDATVSVAGSLDGLASSLSQGPGSGGGSGTGTGTGIGPGTGSGMGPGWGGGFGGGAYRPGSGIENPLVLREVKPQYTPDAMRAKIQGTVVLECVVLPDGTVGDVRVNRSLDPVFGLDQEAVKAARQWRFVPASGKASRSPSSC
jgi:protein TonB